MSVDSIGDFLTRIRNAVARSHTSVMAPYSKLNHQIAEILKREGYIRDVVVEQSDKSFQQLKLFLKYVDGESVIHEIKRVSRPGRRMYGNVSHIPRVIGGLGVAIVTTNVGLVTDREARQKSVGGEILCTVW